MKTITLILAGLTGLMFYACDDWNWNCINGDGDLRTENRSVDNFSRVEVDGDFDVYIDQGNTTSVKVEADDNLQRYILTENYRDKMVISTDHDRCLRSKNPIIVHIITPDVEKIELFGSGNVDCGDLDTPDLTAIVDGSGNMYFGNIQSDEVNFDVQGSGYLEADLNVSSANLKIEGSGEMRVSGVTDVADMNISGSGRIRSNDMDANDCYVTISGSGDIYTFVFNLLDVTISGSGTVYYYGNPDQVVKRISGSGSVIKRN